MRRGQTCGTSLLRGTAQVTLVFVFNGYFRLVTIVAIGTAQLRFIIIEIILLGKHFRAIAGGNIASDGLIVLEKLGLCGIFIVLTLVLRVHGFLALEELLLCTLSFPVIINIFAYISIILLLVD